MHRFYSNSAQEALSNNCGFFFNLRVFIKEKPQQEEQETLRSKDTQFAAVELPLTQDQHPTTIVEISNQNGHFSICRY
jgi:uncharacterized protein YfaS (alpha-2-macroglobulin family)